MTASESAMAEAVVRLRAAGCVFAEDEAAVLGEAASDDTALAALVGRRALGEPLEQVVGYADFCGVRVRLLPGVFVPRVRSELLVRLAVELVRPAVDATSADRAPRDRATLDRASRDRATLDRAPRDSATLDGAPRTVVDLCCGSGALGLAVRRHAPDIDLHAADLDPDAVRCARLNLGENVYQGDLFAALPGRLRRRIDVLIANVPYVATKHIPLLPAEARDHEPYSALDGGDDGLDVFRAVIAQAPGWLGPGGTVLCEITEAQVSKATEAVQAAGLDADVIYDDDLEARVIRGGRRR